MALASSQIRLYMPLLKRSWKACIDIRSLSLRLRGFIQVLQRCLGSTYEKDQLGVQLSKKTLTKTCGFFPNTLLKCGIEDEDG
ncbi:hypothetical protein MKX01_023195, partial [Papaver californicum]